MSDSNPWFDAAKTQLDADQATQIRNNLQSSIDTNPQKETGIRQLYNATGIPIDAIRENEDDVRTSVALRKFDATGLIQSTPRTAQLMTDQNNTKLLHDAIPNTQAVEQTVKTMPSKNPDTDTLSSAIHYLFSTPGDGDTLVGDVGKVASGGLRALAGTGKYLTLAGSTLNRPVDAIFGTHYAEDQLKLTQQQDEYSKGGPTKTASFKDQLLNVVGSTLGVLGEAALTGGTATEARASATVLEALKPHIAHGIQAMMIPASVSAQDTYTSVLEQTHDMSKATTAGLTAYVTSSLGGVVPFATPGALATRVLTGTVMGPVLGDVSHQIMNMALPESMQAPERDGQDRTLDAVMGAMFGGLAGPRSMSDINHRMATVARQSYVDAIKNEANMQSLGALHQVSQVSAIAAMRERDPGMFKQFVADISEDHNAPDLYIDAAELNKAFAQSGITADDLKTAMPGVAAQLHEATEANGMVRIPLAAYATHLAGTEMDKQILPHFRTDPEGMTYHEGQVFFQTQTEQLKASVAKLVADKVNDDTWQNSKQTVHDDVMRQIEETGRVRGDVAQAYASLHASFFETMAARHGEAMDPAEAYRRFGGAKIVAEDLMGGGLNQGKSTREVVADLQAAHPDMKLDVGDRQGEINVSRITLPEDQRNQGAGTKVMQTLMDHADASGKTMTLSPSDSFGGSKPRLKEFYKSLGFVENKGKNRDFTISESMYRLPKNDVLNQSPKDNGVTVEENKQGVLSAKSDFGKVWGVVKGDTLRIMSSKITAEQRGKGYGKELYRAIIDEAHSRGLKVTSDDIVSGSAAKVYDSLAKEGYRVSKTDGVIHLEPDDVEPLGALAGANLPGELWKSHPVFKVAPKAVDYADPKHGISRVLLELGKIESLYQYPKSKALDIAQIASDKGLTITETDRNSTDNKQWMLSNSAPANSEKTHSWIVTIPASEKNGGEAKHATITNDDGMVHINVSGVGEGNGGSAVYDLAANYAANNGLKFIGDPLGVSKSAMRRRLENMLSAAVKYQGTDFLEPHPDQLKGNKEIGVPALDWTERDSLANIKLMVEASVASTKASNPITTSDVHFDTTTQSFRDGENNHLDAERLSALFGFDGRTPGTGQAGNTTVRRSAFFNSLLSGVGERRATLDAIHREQDSPGSGFGGSLDGTFYQGNRGAYDPQTRIIALLKNADLSTFLHESGHFFLDTLSRVAIQQDAPAGIAQDFQKVLDWVGVRDADEWHMMTLDEQRDSHEKFARGFEAYLMEGKAPNVEMQGVFSRFRSWLLNVYKNLSSLNVELTPEVRGVFDRMLASEESIKTAEAVRGYDPIFKSALAAGMTPQEWAEYQTLGSDATNAALENLQSKSIKDMKWLANVKSGAIRDLQKEAKLRRREMKVEAFREVWKEPVYQAWSFLTAREHLDASKNTQAAPKATPEAQSKGVDNTRDSMMTAIAKLGGIDREQLASKWGLKPEEKPESGVFGKHVVRASGKGHTIDNMAAELMREGYLTADENGRHDVNEFEEKFFNELGGSPEYSHAADWEYLKNGPMKMSADDIRLRLGGRLDLDRVRNIDTAAAGKLEALHMTRKDALDPDIVAEMFGFKDGQDLIKNITEAEHPKTAVEGVTDKLMLEKHGELSSPEAIERAAEVAIHNEARGRFVATELKALSKATGPANLIAKAAKLAAESSIARKLISDLRPAMYTAAEARAARNAQKALVANDVQAAAVEKRAQLLNNQLAKAAQSAQTEITKGLDYFKKFDKNSVREKINVDYRDQIDTLLDRFDLRKSVSKSDVARRQSLGNWVEEQAAQGLQPNIPEKLLNELDRKHFFEMSVEEFRGLQDAIKSIEHLGRLKDKLRDRAEMRDLKDLADEATSAMAQLPQRSAESNRGLTMMEAKFVKLKSWGRTAQASLLKMEQMMDWLDGRNPDGVFNRIVFRRIADAGVKENDMRVKVKGLIDDLLGKHLIDVTKDGGKIYTAMGLIDGLTGEAQKFTKKELLMLAGNMGNESNVGKLLAGEKWDESTLWKFLDQHLEKADWDFVAGMGKAIESLWPEQLAMNRRLGNTNPEKIEPRPFATRHGQYDGWYWPMIYDPARASDVADRGAKKADALFENSYTKANTDTGRMNTRNENYARPLLLDLDAFPKTILDSIHDIAFREAVIDADKFLSHPPIREAISSAMSPEHYDQLRPWLQSIANDGKTSDEGMRALKFFNSLAHGARTRATIVGLGYRVSTMLVHGASAGMESVAELGPAWFAKGIKESGMPLTPQWNANKEFIFDRSGEMRNRMNEVDRDVREHLREIETRLMDPATSAFTRATDTMKAHAYQGIAMLDMASALPTWMGAYLKGMSKEADGGLAMSEQDAIYFADKTVRNAHGGTGVKDQAAVQRGPEFFKLFSMFYTFWNHNVNRIMDTTRMAKELPATYREGDMSKFRGDLGSVVMRTLVYTFGVQIMHHMINPPKEDAGEESWAKWAAKELAMAGTAGIPIVRDLAAHFISGKDYSVTPAASMVDAVGRSGQDIWNASTGAKPVSDKWLKHSITTAGYVFGLPTGQAASASQFLWDVEQGKQRPEEVADWWRGLIHGDMKKR